MSNNFLPDNINEIEWGLTAEQHIKNPVNNVELKLKELGTTLHSKKYTP
jgi:hypothetical protein